MYSIMLPALEVMDRGNDWAAIANHLLATEKKADSVIYTLRKILGESGWLMPLKCFSLYSVLSQVTPHTLHVNLAHVHVTI